MAQERIIALVDMDCFYVQVEQRRNPDLRGKPCVVVQYKKYRGGGIIAVGYEARKYGVTRNMRGDDAKQKCPDVHLVHVPENRGKADLTHYREAGAEVIDVLANFTDCLERASIDEAYMDLTASVKSYLQRYDRAEIAEKLISTTHVVGVCPPVNGDTMMDSAEYKQILTLLEDERNLSLAAGAIIANEMRAAVKEKTSFSCSAGVAHNKMLAKLVGGMHKPNQQSLIFQSHVPDLFKDTLIRKARNFGGKLGTSLREIYGIEKMGELAQIELNSLRERLDPKNAEWVYNMGKGIDFEPVRPRQLPKTIGCSKNFSGRERLCSKEKIEYWIGQLISEVCERVKKDTETNNRTPGTLTVSLMTKPWNLISRVLPFCSSDIKSITTGCMKALSEFNVAKTGDTWEPPITCLGFSAGKFVETSSQQTQSVLRFIAKPKETEVICRDTSKPCSTRASEEAIVNRTQSKRGLDKYFGLGKYQGKDCKDSQRSSGCTGHINSKGACLNTEKVKESLSEYSTITLQEKIGVIAETDDGGHEECTEAGGRLPTMSNPGPSSDSPVVKRSDREIRSHELSDFPTAEIIDKSRDAQLDNSSSASGNKASYCAVSSTDAGFSQIENSVAVSRDDVMTCEKCDKMIVVWDLPEHMDFHLASDLSKELNSPHPPAVTSSTDKARLPSKRARVETPNINSFFKPKR